MSDTALRTRLLWIILPEGVRRDAAGRAVLRLSVRLAPRIDGAATLGRCPLLSGGDGSGSWAARARQCRFDLFVCGDALPPWTDVHSAGAVSTGTLDPNVPDETEGARWCPTR
jgi:hypothetical protein